jgi:hypothetical protein
LIGGVVAAVGGAGYYFKIVRGGKNSEYPDDEDEYGYGEDTEDETDGDTGDGGGAI